MIKYLTSQKYRLKRQEFSELEMIGDDFENFKPEKVRVYIRTLGRLKINTEVRECI